MVISFSRAMEKLLDYLKIVTKMLSVFAIHHIESILSHRNYSSLNIFSQYPTAISKRCRPLSPKSIKGHETKYWYLKTEMLQKKFQRSHYRPGSSLY